MKPLVKKILESGLVDKHAAKMFERWGQLDEGASDLVGKKKVTEQTLEEFAEDIEVLLEDKSEVRETRLEVPITAEIDFRDDLGNQVRGYVDVMGHVLVPVVQKARIQRGSRICVDGNRTHTVLDIDTVYQNDEMVALQLTVTKPE